MEKGKGSPTPSQIGRYKKNVDLRRSGRKLIARKHSDWNGRIGEQPVTHVVRKEWIVCDVFTPPVQEINGRLVAARFCLSWRQIRGSSPGVLEFGKRRVNAAHSGKPNSKTKIDIRMRDRGVFFIKTTYIEESVAS